MFSFIRNRIRNRIFRSVFDSTIGKKVFGALNGRKTLVGRVLQFVSALILLAQTHFPEFVIVGDINAFYSFVAGWLVTEIGIEHKVVKSEIK